MEPSELLRVVVTKLDAIAVNYFVTGSMATIAYGEPRFTNDLDVLIQLAPDDVEAFCSSFPANDFYLNDDAVRDAIRRQSQFNVIHPSSGLKVDFIILGSSEFDKSRQSRAVLLRPDSDYEAMFASAEDVVLKKMEFYKLGGSEKHLRDITGVLKVRGEQLDRDYIAQWAKRLEVEEVWQAVLGRIQQGEV